jgi:hypothetical protein
MSGKMQHNEAAAAPSRLAAAIAPGPRPTSLSFLIDMGAGCIL